MNRQPIAPTSELNVELDAELDAAGEALLRATLAAHAPTAMDADRGWAAIAGQIGAAEPARQRTQPARPAALRAPRRLMRLPRTFTGIAAAVAVAAVLMGTGFGIVYELSLKGAAIQQQQLYTVINQRQTDQGITFVVDRAYADSGSTSILYYVELSPALAARGYTGATPMTFDLTDQYGDEGGGGTIACHPGAGAVLRTCEIDNAPFVVPAGTTRLTMDFDIYRTLLQRGGGHPRTDMVQGMWSFEFTVPYHQKSLGPGSGPYPQPTAPVGLVPRVSGGA
jgi:hypothetical protein